MYQSHIVKAYIISIITLATYLIGEFNTPLKILIILMIIDWCAGVIKAIVEKNLDSRVGFIGIIKKIFILLMVCVAYMLDKIIGEFGLEVQFIRNLTISYYILNEMLSIIENIGVYIPIPKKVKELLQQLKEKEDYKDTDE